QHREVRYLDRHVALRDREAQRIGTVQLEKLSGRKGAHVAFRRPVKVPAHGAGIAEQKVQWRKHQERGVAALGFFMWNGLRMRRKRGLKPRSSPRSDAALKGRSSTKNLSRSFFRQLFRLSVP